MNRNEKMNSDIKIYVACHKPTYVPKNPYLYPIQVGTALSDVRLEGMLHDDDGDNISSRNRSYCELTAQYWAWKNSDADYYGFFHYRRYFSFDPGLNRDDGWGNIVYDQIDKNVIQECRLDPKSMRELITSYDVICVKGRKLQPSAPIGKAMDIYHEYGAALSQHREDLDITLQVLLEKYPEFESDAKEYMGSSIAHECNMFIMKREIFHEYAEWLFNILFEVEKRIDTTWYSVEEYRVMGYLAERLCGVYCHHLKKQATVRAFELPKTLFLSTAPHETLSPAYPDGVPIVLSANNRFAPYLDVMIRSVIANALEKRNYDIIILYNDISEKNRNMIQSAAESFPNIAIRFIRVSEYFDSSKLFVDQHLSVETYYRLIIPDIMPDYHKILYLDCDMVADRDVAELFDMDLGGNIIGAVKDIDVAGQIKRNINDWSSYAAKTLGLECVFDYFQAGALILNLDKLRKTASSEKMIRMALEHSYRCHDQDILNMVCKNQVTYIPQQWNVLMNWREPGRSRMQILQAAPRALFEEYTAARRQPYLIHFAGYQKPWDVVDCDFAEYFWKYAKLSPYYPVLLRQIKRCFAEEQNTKEPEAVTYNQESLLRRISVNLLPYGSGRREWVKKIYKRVINVLCRTVG